MKIIQAQANGQSLSSIAREMKRGKSAVINFFKRWRREGTMERKKGQGRKRITTEREGRHIVMLVNNNRFITGKMLKEDQVLSHLSCRTIFRRISESGEFNSYWACVKPFISRKNRVIRVQWCKDHLNWTKEQWHGVLFTDESPFVLR